MKRLINFIKRNKSIFLACLALVLFLSTLFSIIMVIINENNGATLTEKEQTLYLLMFVFSSMALGITCVAIIQNAKEEERKATEEFKRRYMRETFDLYDE